MKNKYILFDIYFTSTNLNQFKSVKNLIHLSDFMLQKVSIGRFLQYFKFF